MDAEKRSRVKKLLAALPGGSSNIEHLAAARQAGLHEVPVRVERVTDDVWNRLRMKAAEAAGR